MNPLSGIANLLDLALEVYLWIIFAAVLFSWFPLSPYNPAAQKIIRFLHNATEPVFAVFRRTFQLHRYTAPLDVTPLVVILTIYFLRIFAVQTLRNMSPVSNFFQAVLYTLFFVLNIYFWIVAVAAFFVVMVCFFPYHAVSRTQLPFIKTLTEPVFEFFRRLFRSRLQIAFHNVPRPLDASPFLALALIFFLKRLLIGMAQMF